MIPPIVILLAGGQSRRMGGGDKCLRPLGGKPILSHLIERLAPQAPILAINANGDGRRFERFGLPVFPDLIEGFAGPLAGVLSGFAWARRYHPKALDILTVPTDAPFVPTDLVECLMQGRSMAGAELACAASAGQSHPVVGLWPLALEDDLREAVTVEGIRKVDLWTERHRLVTVDFPMEKIDPFFNTNEPADLAEAERLLAL